MTDDHDGDDDHKQGKDDLPPLHIVPPLITRTAGRDPHRKVKGRPPKLTKDQAEQVAMWLATGWSVTRIRAKMIEEGMPEVSERTIRYWATEWEQRVMELSATQQGYHRIAESTTVLHRDIYVERLIELEDHLREFIDDPGKGGNYPRLGQYIKVLGQIARLQGHDQRPGHGTVDVTPGRGHGQKVAVIDGDWQSKSPAELRALRDKIFGPPPASPAYTEGLDSQSALPQQPYEFTLEPLE